MQAPQQHLSTLKLNFGKPLDPQLNTPTHAQLQLHLFSPQQTLLRQTLQAQIQQTLPNTCLILQLPVTKGSAQTFAAELTQLTKQMSAENESDKLQFFSCEGNLLVMASGEALSSFVEEYESQLKQVSTSAPDQQNQHISLSLLSKNTISQVYNLAKAKSIFGAIDSLTLSFEFLKTELIGLFLSKVIEKLTFDNNFTSLITSFKQFNLEINAASSSLLDEFPKLQLGGGVEGPLLGDNEIARKIRESGIEECKVFGLNSSMLLVGNLRAEGLGQLIQSLQ